MDYSDYSVRDLCYIEFKATTFFVRAEWERAMVAEGDLLHGRTLREIGVVFATASAAVAYAHQQAFEHGVTVEVHRQPSQLSRRGSLEHVEIRPDMDAAALARIVRRFEKGRGRGGTITLRTTPAIDAWNAMTDEQRRYLLTDGGYDTPADAMRALGHAVPDDVT